MISSHKIILGFIVALIAFSLIRRIDNRQVIIWLNVFSPTTDLNKGIDIVLYNSESDSLGFNIESFNLELDVIQTFGPKSIIINININEDISHIKEDVENEKTNNIILPVNTQGTSLTYSKNFVFDSVTFGHNIVNPIHKLTMNNYEIFNGDTIPSMALASVGIENPKLYQEILKKNKTSYLKFAGTQIDDFNYVDNVLEFYSSLEMLKSIVKNKTVIIGDFSYPQTEDNSYIINDQYAIHKSIMLANAVYTLKTGLIETSLLVDIVALFIAIASIIIISRKTQRRLIRYLIFTLWLASMILINSISLVNLDYYIRVDAILGASLAFIIFLEIFSIINNRKINSN
ncbi:MAG: hypothetical protein JXR03_21620 [Cyclobacteriaceae bacterium]